MFFPRGRCCLRVVGAIVLDSSFFFYIYFPPFPFLFSRIFGSRGRCFQSAQAAWRTAIWITWAPSARRPSSSVIDGALSPPSPLRALPLPLQGRQGCSPPLGLRTWPGFWWGFGSGENGMRDPEKCCIFWGRILLPLKVLAASFLATWSTWGSLFSLSLSGTFYPFFLCKPRIWVR